MKRIISLFSVLVLTLAVALPMQAQTVPHFKFMGIPINGVISSFQSKLAAKGFTYDASASKESGPGIRRFNGMFSGYKAKLAVFYDPKTKIVNDVKVMIDRYSENAAETLYEEMCGNIRTKYAGKSECEDTVFEGEKCTTFTVYHDDVVIGNIIIYIQNPTYDTYWVAIEYVDVVNFNKNTDSKLEDL